MDYYGLLWQWIVVNSTEFLSLPHLLEYLLSQYNLNKVAFTFLQISCVFDVLLCFIQ